MIITFLLSLFHTVGADYLLEPTMLTFPTGSQCGSRQCVNVSIINDIEPDVENTESFHIQLSTNDTNVEPSSICNRALFRIYDSDGERVPNTTDL